MKHFSKNLFSIFALIFLCSLLDSCRITPNPSAEDGAPPPPLEKNATDNDILANLKTNSHLTVEEKGGGGDCLFHSFREQITKEELAKVDTKKLLPIDAQNTPWNCTNYNGSASSRENSTNILRNLAVQKMAFFLDENKGKSFSELSDIDQTWIHEMAKDFYEEKNGSAEKTYTWFQSATDENKWKYVKDNKDKYLAKEIKAGCWAGTAEAIALARALGRGLRMYGNDKASRKYIKQKDLAKPVEPYFSLPGVPGQEDLLVFQTNGGGHYRMLKEILSAPPPPPSLLRPLTVYDIGEHPKLYINKNSPAELLKEDRHLFLHTSGVNQEKIERQMGNTWTIHRVEPNKLNDEILKEFNQRPSERVMINFKTHGADPSGNLCYKNGSCTYAAQNFIQLLNQLEEIYKRNEYPKQIFINPTQCYHKAFMDKIEEHLKRQPTSFSVAYFSMVENNENDDSILTPFSNLLDSIDLRPIVGALALSTYEEGQKNRELLLQLELDKKDLTTLEEYEAFLNVIYELFPAEAEIRKFKLHTFLGSAENKSFLLKDFHIPTQLELSYKLSKYHVFENTNEKKAETARDEELPNYKTKPEVQVVAHPERDNSLALSEVHIHNYLNNNQNLIGRLTKAEKVENPGKENEIRTEIPKEIWGNYYKFNPDGNINFNITDFSLTFKLTED